MRTLNTNHPLTVSTKATGRKKAIVDDFPIPPPPADETGRFDRYRDAS